MALKQVITIGPDGSISGLDRKKGEGINIKALGRAEVVRASQIEWHEGYNVRGYKIEFLTGPRKGTTLTVNEFGKYACSELPDVLNPEGGEDFALFEDYGECVKVEIFILDDDRRQGKF